MKLTFKKKVAIFTIVGAVLTVVSAVGTVFSVKKHKAAKAAIEAK